MATAETRTEFAISLQAIIVPRHAFATDAAFDRFVQLLEDHRERYGRRDEQGAVVWPKSPLT